MIVPVRSSVILALMCEFRFIEKGRSIKGTELSGFLKLEGRCLKK